MNKRQLRTLGVPEHALTDAVQAISRGVLLKAFHRGKQAEAQIQELLRNPLQFQGDAVFGALAEAVRRPPPDDAPSSSELVPEFEYAVWGKDLDPGSLRQMREACSLPVSRKGALMADAHIGYGLPIGGVLATENAVIPYAVGVDIACRMRLSITDLPVDDVKEKPDRFDRALTTGTRFGVGSSWQRNQDHSVMDEDWSITSVTNDAKKVAWEQLGTSGSGNHFVEWGILSVPTDELGVPAGKYVALLSHSGSRGAGAKVCSHYSRIAENLIPDKYKEVRRLGWLSLDQEAGQAYWAAMNLMGEYAAANHAVIHRNVLDRIGGTPLVVIENHHNFAWKEVHDGKEYVVHRKGATPAGEGVLGVIPGTMADPAFVVRGKGNPQSLLSASHGAGRAMSRTEARRRFTWKMWKHELEKRGVRVLAAGVDELPGVYKNIHEVMAAQTDLVEVLADFKPAIVLMCGDGSKAED
ncbi:MAG: RtcB family protein [Planctomycetia bacterium]